MRVLSSNWGRGAWKFAPLAESISETGLQQDCVDPEEDGTVLTVSLTLLPIVLPTFHRPPSGQSQFLFAEGPGYKRALKQAERLATCCAAHLSSHIDAHLAQRWFCCCLFATRWWLSVLRGVTLVIQHDQLKGSQPINPCPKCAGTPDRGGGPHFARPDSERHVSNSQYSSFVQGGDLERSRLDHSTRQVPILKHTGGYLTWWVALGDFRGHGLEFSPDMSGFLRAFQR